MATARIAPAPWVRASQTFALHVRELPERSLKLAKEQVPLRPVRVGPGVVRLADNPHEAHVACIRVQPLESLEEFALVRAANRADMYPTPAAQSDVNVRETGNRHFPRSAEPSGRNQASRPSIQVRVNVIACGAPVGLESEALLGQLVDVDVGIEGDRLARRTGGRRGADIATRLAADLELIERFC